MGLLKNLLSLFALFLFMSTGLFAQQNKFVASDQQMENRFDQRVVVAQPQAPTAKEAKADQAQKEYFLKEKQADGNAPVATQEEGDFLLVNTEGEDDIVDDGTARYRAAKNIQQGSNRMRQNAAQKKAKDKADGATP